MILELAEKILNNLNYKWLKKRVEKKCKIKSEHTLELCPYSHKNRTNFYPFKRYCVYGYFCKYQNMDCKLPHFNTEEETISYITSLDKFLQDNEEKIYQQMNYISSLRSLPIKSEMDNISIRIRNRKNIMKLLEDE